MDLIDELVPNAAAAKLLGVTRRTLTNWDGKPELGFPKAIKVCGRNYRSLPQIKAWHDRLRDNPQPHVALRSLARRGSGPDSPADPKPPLEARPKA